MPHSIDLRLLGPVHVEVDGVPVRSFASRKTLALLCYVALAERPVPRSRLASWFWGDKSPTQARANLSWSLHALQSAVPGVVEADREMVAWKRHVEHRLDVDSLDLILQCGDPQALNDGLVLYRGNLLEGLELNGCSEWELWLQSERTRWSQRVAQALHTLADHYLQTRAYADGLACIARLLQLDPLDEYAHLKRMLLLHRSGQRTAALAHYDAYRQILAQELGVEPDAEIMALDAALRRPAPYVRSVSLALSQTIIGRDVEIQTLTQRLLQTDSRLLCICGPGGVGKTTLALHVAAQIGSHFAQGTAVVLLEDIADAGLIPAALAAALPLVAAGQDDPWSQVVRYLSSRQMLLVLDTWEHLRAAGGLVVDLLEHAPGLRLLITSRERIDLAYAEHLTLRGLELDTQANGYDMPGAARLFVQQARRVQPSLDVTSAILQDILEICRLVDGLPLAIVLASAWVRVLSPAEILQELRQNMDLLDQGFHDLPERHRSIRALLRPADVS